MAVDLKRQDFGGYDFDTTLAYFKYIIRNPGDVRNGETRGEWFARCHDISGADFAEIMRARISEPEYRRIMATKNRPYVGLKR